MEHEWTFDALGTRWWLVTANELSAAHKNQLAECVQTFEAAYSRFKPTSYIGVLNTKKQLTDYPGELRDMLNFALTMYTTTDGVFNISIGSELEKSGYGNGLQANSRVSSDLLKDVHISTERIEVAPWIRLDFGGFGKGWLVDKLSVMLTELSYEQHLVNGGGDIMVRGSTEVLQIEDPQDDTQAIGEVNIKDASLCSSSRNKRVWKSPQGKLVSHIPYKEDKALPVPLSMHVRAGSALIADTLSTVFLLVEGQKRQTLAKQFLADYLVINANRSFNATPGFEFLAYI